MTRGLYFSCADVIKQIKLFGASQKSAIYKKENDKSLKAVLKVCQSILSEFDLLETFENYIIKTLKTPVENKWQLYVLLHESIMVENKLKIGGKVAR